MKKAKAQITPGTRNDAQHPHPRPSLTDGDDPQAQPKLNQIQDEVPIRSQQKLWYTSSDDKANPESPLATPGKICY